MHTSFLRWLIAGSCLLVAARAQAQSSAPAPSNPAVAALAMSEPVPDAPSARVRMAAPELAPIAAAPVTTTMAATRRSAPVAAVTPGETRTWRGLTIAGHGAAFFDAWSTRASLSSGRGYERNPLMRPFAGNSSMYAATQVAPTGLD